MEGDAHKLYQNAQDMIDIYEDHIGITEPRYSEIASMEILKQQVFELYCICFHLRQNLTKTEKDKQTILDQYNRVGVIVSLSSMGVTLNQFINFVNQTGTSQQDGSNELLRRLKHKESENSFRKRDKYTTLLSKMKIQDEKQDNIFIKQKANYNRIVDLSATRENKEEIEDEYNQSESRHQRNENMIISEEKMHHPRIGAGQPNQKSNPGHYGTLKRL
jgi:hypothetical protein